MNASNPSPYAMFPDQDVAALQDLLSSPRKIVITTHANPDGDAIGSSLGLWWLMQRQGHDCKVITPNQWDHFLAWLPGTGSMFNAYRDMKKAEEMFNEADIVFCLDFSAARRVGDLESILTKAPGKKVMIDHHLDPEDWADIFFHAPGLSSTAEMVFRLAAQLGLRSKVDKWVAECLYTGLMTDTGSFRFSTTTADVHRIVAELVDTGLDVGYIHNRVYDQQRESRLRLLGYLLYERLQVLPQYKTAYLTITIEDIKKFKVKSGDTEGIVNYTLSLKGIRFGVLMKETPDGTKLSLRSIGDFPCNDFAGHFNGGGHKNASGGKNDGTLAETEEKFRSLLEEYKHLLIS